MRLKPPPVIMLDEATHQYTVDGEPKRSWSQIAREAGLLEDLSNVPAHHLENAKARGSQVDDGCALLMEGCPLDVVVDRMHPEAQPYVYAYWDFWTDICAPDFHVQTPLYSAELDFCCTPDWHDDISVNDIKATAKPSRTWGLQTAAQAMAHSSFGNVLRRIIWLRPKLRTRSYEVHVSSYGAHGLGEDRRIFSIYDFDVVRAACRGDYSADCIKRWRAGE